VAFPIEYVLFVATLVGIAVWHKRALTIALAGLAATAVYKLLVSGFGEAGSGPSGLALHFAHEWVILLNLLLLLVGFAVLARHFEHSNLPHALPRHLPAGVGGGVALLAIVWVLSAVLDNIAAAVIGGVMAKHVYQSRVSLGFLAAIVASANAGGAWSVLGDTTTTMMWVGGVSPLQLTHAFPASLAAFLVFAIAGAIQQHRHAPAELHDGPVLTIDWMRILVVGVALAAIVSANVLTNSLIPQLEHLAPVLGIALWVALMVMLWVRSPDWTVMPEAFKGAMFLVALVALASLMPLEGLPTPSWLSTFALGWLSAVFDNIPLTALALSQNGYDWPLLAFAVGFGGSMVWFGSSAGVALTGLFPEGRSALRWLLAGWHVVVGYVVGFFVLLGLDGWDPTMIAR
jgi:Na+/H+ antiporter NhaD/arsenite permease-like protein